MITGQAHMRRYTTGPVLRRSPAVRGRRSWRRPPAPAAGIPGRSLLNKRGNLRGCARTVAVEAITFGRTFFPFTSHVARWSIAPSLFVRDPACRLPNGLLIQMQLILNNSGRAAEANRGDSRNRRIFSRRLMRVRILEFRRTESVARAESVHLSEQRLDLTLPRHLRKLIDRRNHHGRGKPVDLFIDDQQREPFVRRLSGMKRKLALPE